jgi:hypothetical protein
MSKQRIQIVVAIERDGGVELIDASGKSRGHWVKLDSKRAQIERGARRSLAADLAVAAFVVSRCKGHRGQTDLTDAQIARATKLAVASVFRAKQRLRRSLFEWRVLGRGKGCRYILRRQR